MRDEWQKVRLGDVADIRTGKLNSNAACSNGKFPFFTCAATPLRIDSFAFDCEAVIVAGNCSPYMHYYNGKFNAYQRTYVVKPFLDSVDGRWLYYWMKTLVKRLISGQRGSVEPYLVMSDFTDAEIPLPPLETQKKIAAVLGALDDKIELNRKMNANLEAQAQALFKSWFVDFTPFGGKMPKGWKNDSVYSLCNIIYGAPYKSSLFNDAGEGRKVIRIRDLKNHDTKVYTTEVHDKEYLVQPGDIVVGMDGEFTPYVWGGETVLLNQRLCVFNPIKKEDRGFLYFQIYPLLKEIERTEVATTVIHIGKQDFDRFVCLIPDNNTRTRFSNLVEPMLSMIVSNSLESRKLAELRDTLLPKLMKGEIIV